MTSLILLLAFVSQTPADAQAPSAAKKEQQKAEAPRGTVDAKKAEPGNPRTATARPGMSEEYQRGLRSTLERRRAATRKKAMTRQQKAQVEKATAQALRDWEARVGPTIAAQQRERMRLQIMQQMANAASLEASANAARARLESQALGQPQIFVPGQGMMPYPYSIVPPLNPYVYPLPVVPAAGAGQATTPQ
jgi:hypothetical protein